MSEGIIEKKCINIEKKSINITHDSYSISIYIDGMGQIEYRPSEFCGLVRKYEANG